MSFLTREWISFVNVVSLNNVAKSTKKAAVAKIVQKKTSNTLLISIYQSSKPFPAGEVLPR